MTTENGRTTDEAHIRSAIDARVAAVRAKDIDGAMPCHAPDVLLFDVVNPLRCVGSTTVRERTR